MLSVFLACEDPYATADLFTGRLGWRLVFATPRDSADRLACVSLGDAQVMLGTDDEEFLPAASREHRGAGVTVYVRLPDAADIAAVHARHAEAGVATAPLSTREWGEGAFDARIAGYRFLITQEGTVGGMPSTITADDLESAVRLAVTVLEKAPDGAWDGKAGGLEWTCWETVEHLSDDLFAYAAQLGARPKNREVPFLWESRRPGGPANVTYADRDAGPSGLLEVLEACGAMLVALVRTTPPDVRAHHVFGASDPEGFAAMGIVETLVHTHDIAQGLGLTWDPPADLVARTLARLFPDAPRDTAPWPTLLWATGRGDLPGHARVTKWRWTGTPHLN
ncbi:DinB family protein [Actinomadura violacea]|nr:DinB family protein [Actinomadura violacea]